MSQFDKYISDADKAVIIQQRIRQFAAEGYQQELNREIAVENENTEAVEQIDIAIEAIKEAIAYQEDLLSNLEITED